MKNTWVFIFKKAHFRGTLHGNLVSSYLSAIFLVALFLHFKEKHCITLMFLGVEREGWLFMCVKEWHPQPIAIGGQFFPGTPVCSNWSWSKLGPEDLGLALQMYHHFTIFIPHLSDDRDGLGMLQPGKAVPWPCSFTKLTAANAPVEAG